MRLQTLALTRVMIVAFLLLLVVVLVQYLIKTNGRVLALGGDADIGAKGKLVSGKAKAQGAGTSHNDHNGVGGGITQPFFTESLCLGSMRVLQGCGGGAAGKALVGHSEKKQGVEQSVYLGKNSLISHGTMYP